MQPAPGAGGVDRAAATAARRCGRAPPSTPRGAPSTSAPGRTTPCPTACARASHRPAPSSGPTPTASDPDNHLDSHPGHRPGDGPDQVGASTCCPSIPGTWGACSHPGSRRARQPYGPDHDLGSSPNLYTATIDGRVRDVVGSGQKSGRYWALDRDTGEEIWHTDVGPGSRLGGIEWGTAYDGERIYAPIGNIGGTPYTGPDGKQLTFGSWAALDPATGRIQWQTQDPGTYLNAALGSPAMANGVMFGASLSATGNNFYALDAATGRDPLALRRRAPRASPPRPSSTGSSTGEPATTGSTSAPSPARSSTRSVSAAAEQGSSRGRPGPRQGVEAGALRPLDSNMRSNPPGRGELTR